MCLTLTFTLTLVYEYQRKKRQVDRSVSRIGALKSGIVYQDKQNRPPPRVALNLSVVVVVVNLLIV